MPAQDLSSLSPEDQETLIALAQGGGSQGYLDRLPQKRATREDFSKRESGTKKIELEKELGPEILSTPAFSAIRERAEGLPLLALQGRGVDSLEGALSELKSEPQRIDYRPLLGAVASLGGPDLSKFYEAPPSPLERKQLEIKLQDLIQRRRESEALTQLKAMFGQKIPQQVIATSGTTQTAGGEKGDKTTFLTQTPMGTGKAGAVKPPDTRELSKRLEMLPELVESARKLRPFINRSDIPGVGVGEKFTPDFLRSPSGSLVRQLALNLFMNQVYLKSGKAITENEAKIQMKQLGMHWDQGDAAFRKGFKNLIDNAEATARQVQSGYAPEVVEEFKKRGGITSDKAREMIFGGTKKKSVPSQDDISKMSKEQLKEYLSK